MEAIAIRDAGTYPWTPTAALTGGDVIQLPDGRAGFIVADVAASAAGTAQTSGVYKLQKTASIAILRGGRVYWDHSANKAHYKKVNDRDFYVGRAVADSSESATEVDVEFNIDPPYDIDIARTGFKSVITGTPAAGAFGYPVNLGGALILELTATNEAQCVDALLVDGFAKGANAIVEAVFRILSDGSNATQDFNIGLASATHASDADQIAESVFCHVDGNSTNLALESDDGTTEVAATDSTIDYTEGVNVANRVEVWFDLRDPADVQIYINGALALTATTFNIDAAAGPLFLLAHLEKSSSTDTYKVAVDRLCARFIEE